MVRGVWAQQKLLDNIDGVPTLLAPMTPRIDFALRIVTLLGFL